MQGSPGYRCCALLSHRCHCPPRWRTHLLRPAAAAPCASDLLSPRGNATAGAARGVPGVGSAGCSCHWAGWRLPPAAGGLEEAPGAVGERFAESPRLGDGQVVGMWANSALLRTSNALLRPKVNPTPRPDPDPSPETGVAGWQPRKVDAPPSLAAGTTSESYRFVPISPALRQHSSAPGRDRLSFPPLPAPQNQPPPPPYSLPHRLKHIPPQNRVSPPPQNVPHLFALDKNPTWTHSLKTLSSVRGSPWGLSRGRRAVAQSGLG